jgi:hypothetical protein
MDMRINAAAQNIIDLMMKLIGRSWVSGRHSILLNPIVPFSGTWF